MNLQKNNEDNKKTGKSGWQNCPSGQLSKFVNRTQAEQNVLRRRKFLAQASVLGAFVVGGGAIAWMLRQDDAGPDLKLTCSEASELMDQYRKSLLSETDAKKFENHLAKCSNCKTMFDNQAWVDNQA